MTYSIEVAAPNQVDQIWPTIGPGMETACRNSHSSMTSDYLWSECRSGRAFLVIVAKDGEFKAASVWRFEQTVTSNRLHCLMVHGKELLGWAEQHRLFAHEMARAGGATSIILDGRKAHSRIYPNAKIIRITYEEEVNGR